MAGEKEQAREPGTGMVLAAATPGGPTALTRLTVNEMVQMAKMLAMSGLLPKALQKLDSPPAGAFAIILAGQEIGLPPMLAIRSMNLIDGKVFVGADALLGAFKRAGGRASFTKHDETEAVLWVRHPNGDEHTETFTIEMAKAMGLYDKLGPNGSPSMYRKNPKAMLRARAVTAALKSVGWEPAGGVYDPDEAQHFGPEGEKLAEREATTGYTREPVPAEPAASEPVEATAVAPEPAPDWNGKVDEQPERMAGPPKPAEREATGVKMPFGKHAKLPCDTRGDDGQYLVEFKELQDAAAWLLKKRDNAKPNSPDAKKFADWLEGIEAEMERRAIQDDPEPEHSPGDAELDPPGSYQHSDEEGLTAAGARAEAAMDGRV
jgi:hypothetical protein